MKKFSLIILIVFLFCTTGCIKRDTLEDIDIYTTLYPIEYITDRLYGTHSNIYSIYPNGVDVERYELTDKLIKDYSSASLVIFNGINKEKDFVISMYENNKKIKIIDSTLSMEYANSYEEMWLDPLNYLMMIQNVRTGFKQYITNHYLKNEIDENYEKLKLDFSTIDANLKEIAENAKEKTIVVADDDLKVFSKYGLNIISIDPDTANDKAIADAKDLFNNKKVSYIFIKKGAEDTDTIKEIKEKYSAKTLEIDTLNNISLENKNNDKNYITIMNENLDNLKEELY